MMRQGSNTGGGGRRPRGRTGRKQQGGGPSRPNNFDSNGPDVRVRGNARQVYEKYLTLARDATSAGDRVAAEAYYQYAEHYFRILSDSTDPQPGGRRPENRQDDRQDDRQSDRQNDRQGARQSGDDDGEAVVTGGNGATAPEEPAMAPGNEVSQDSEASRSEAAGEEAQQRPRRGRPRKPRVSEEDKARKQEAAPETESGPAAT